MTFKPGQEVIIIGDSWNVYTGGRAVTVIRWLKTRGYLVEHQDGTREWKSERYLSLPTDTDQRRIELKAAIQQQKESLRNLGNKIGPITIRIPLRPKDA